ncbi:MAG: glucan biosynthesis protein [Geminicoccaceae bacterium]
MYRRDLALGLLSLPFLNLLLSGRVAAAPGGIQLGEQAPFDPASVHEMARKLASEDYQPPENQLPAVLRDLSYDQQRQIRFKPEMALWRGQGLEAEVQFFHLGHQYRTPVHVYEVAEGFSREVLYAPELFDFGSNQIDTKFSEHLGFAGFRLHGPLNRPDYLDEIAVFLGASYFRALGRNQHYGLSARGIAINTGLPDGEEFPAFQAFWLERPAPGWQQLVVHALLNGPSLTGAYTFILRPGATTVMDVRGKLYVRQAVGLLGIAPLTSMFLFGANDRVGVDDFRPDVHDSEGLQIWTGRGEWLWRPLVNPNELRISVFADENPRGFGLLQRTRDFEAYEDLEARYDLRPSLWVEPQSAWGQGDVRLIELPTDLEVHDNIVAFWAPKQAVEAGSEWQLDYRLYWCVNAPFRPDVAKTAATRTGAGGAPGDSDARRFVIDFEGGQLLNVPDGAPVEAAVWVSRGEITQPVTHKNPITGGWRAFFDLKPDGDGPVELRCVLRFGEDVLSETWTYQWTR